MVAQIAKLDAFLSRNREAAKQRYRDSLWETVGVLHAARQANNGSPLSQPISTSHSIADTSVTGTSAATSQTAGMAEFYLAAEHAVAEWKYSYPPANHSVLKQFTLPDTDRFNVLRAFRQLRSEARQAPTAKALDATGLTMTRSAQRQQHSMEASRGFSRILSRQEEGGHSSPPLRRKRDTGAAPYASAGPGMVRRLSQSPPDHKGPGQRGRSARQQPRLRQHQSVASNQGSVARSPFRRRLQRSRSTAGGQGASIGRRGSRSSSMERPAWNSTVDLKRKPAWKEIRNDVVDNPDSRYMAPVEDDSQYSLHLQDGTSEYRSGAEDSSTVGRREDSASTGGKLSLSGARSRSRSRSRSQSGSRTGSRSRLSARSAQSMGASTQQSSGRVRSVSPRLAAGARIQRRAPHTGPNADVVVDTTDATSTQSEDSVDAVSAALATMSAPNASITNLRSAAAVLANASYDRVHLSSEAPAADAQATEPDRCSAPLRQRAGPVDLSAHPGRSDSRKRASSGGRNQRASPVRSQAYGSPSRAESPASSVMTTAESVAELLQRPASPRTQGTRRLLQMAADLASDPLNRVSRPPSPAMYPDQSEHAAARLNGSGDMAPYLSPPAEYDPEAGEASIDGRRSPDTKRRVDSHSNQVDERPRARPSGKAATSPSMQLAVSLVPATTVPAGVDVLHAELDLRQLAQTSPYDPILNGRHESDAATEKPSYARDAATRQPNLNSSVAPSSRDQSMTADELDAMVGTLVSDTDRITSAAVPCTPPPPRSPRPRPVASLPHAEQSPESPQLRTAAVSRIEMPLDQSVRSLHTSSLGWPHPDPSPSRSTGPPQLNTSNCRILPRRKKTPPVAPELSLAIAAAARASTSVAESLRPTQPESSKAIVPANQRENGTASEGGHSAGPGRRDRPMLSRSTASASTSNSAAPSNHGFAAPSSAAPATSESSRPAASTVAGGRKDGAETAPQQPSCPSKQSKPPRRGLAQQG